MDPDVFAGLVGVLSPPQDSSGPPGTEQVNPVTSQIRAALVDTTL